MARSQSPARRYTYSDLAAFPDDHLRREIIDGELIVTASPIVRHQISSGWIHHRLMTHAQTVGGIALAAPMDVFFADDNVVEPDLIFVRADQTDDIGDRYVRVVPDLLVEISSPSTRRLELVRKRELYQRFGVPEYWFIDLEADRVEIYVLEDDTYSSPRLVYAADRLVSTRLEGFSMDVEEALGLRR
jgi:Uma2 family endonuclease